MVLRRLGVCPFPHAKGVGFKVGVQPSQGASALDNIHGFREGVLLPQVVKGLGTDGKHGRGLLP